MPQERINSKKQTHSWLLEALSSFCLFALHLYLSWQHTLMRKLRGLGSQVSGKPSTRKLPCATCSVQMCVSINDLCAQACRADAKSPACSKEHPSRAHTMDWMAAATFGMDLLSNGADWGRAAYEGGRIDLGTHWHWEKRVTTLQEEEEEEMEMEEEMEGEEVVVLRASQPTGLQILRSSSLSAQKSVTAHRHDQVGWFHS